MRSPRHNLSFAAFSLALLLAAVGQAAVVAPGPDPQGDTFNGDEHDILSMNAGLDGTDLVVTITFLNPITAPSTFVGNQLFGLIAIDLYTTVPVDLESALSQLHGGVQSPMPAGIEYYIDLSTEGDLGFGLAPGEVAVIDSFPQDIGIAFATYASNSVTVRVALSLLGNPDVVNGNVAVGAVVGGPTLASDQVPGALAAVPEPASLSAWCLAGLGLALARRRQRSNVTSRCL
jgi:hypothetical protein